MAMATVTRRRPQREGATGGRAKCKVGLTSSSQFPPAYPWKPEFVFIKENGLPEPSVALNKSVCGLKGFPC